MTEVSFKSMKKIPSELIQQRIESVKIITQTETDLYEVVKDQLTGEHFLHYGYLHRNIADTGAPEEYHHLLPLESDDVLGLIFGEQPYEYPHHWHRLFLRNGPEGFYIWFDPSYEEERSAHEQIGEQLADKLKRFKEAGIYDEETIRKLLNDLDET